MTNSRWVRSNVERLLQDEWDVWRVEHDDEGDYQFRRGTAACWVSILETGDLPFIRVFAYAADGLKPTAALFPELNDIQLRCSPVAVMWFGGRAMVSQTISPIGLTRSVLAQAIDAVGNVADDIGVLLASMFGGSTPYPVKLPEPENEEAA
jgi:hypothetical protein